MRYSQPLRRVLTAIARLRSWFAWNLGISAARKEEVYLDIAQSVTLTDTSYWLQVLFAAGIATLGLVLNSPAVIIGAMLISPLMGSILANGLALAAGDVILAFRALLNLFLSCSLAILFAVVLVSVLPFKEMTSEILARTRPNLLDLGVALFSGAVGAVSICKVAKGIATSIPGVSIAVALMPPLCVVGYGIGIAVSVNPRTGLQVAQGGGLLFLTNFIAITFSAMLVFLALHIDTNPVREQVRAWRGEDPESQRVQVMLDRVPGTRRLKRIGSLPGRLLLIVVTILIISIPLGQSLGQLRNEITAKQQENRLRNTTTEVWQNNFAVFPDGQIRSYINALSFKSQPDRLAIQLQVYTSRVYTKAEQTQFKQLLAERLRRPVESIALNLVEVPTASNELLQGGPEAELPVLPTIAELQASFLQEIEASLRLFKLPKPAQWINYTVTTSPEVPLTIQINYLSDRDIDQDGQTLLTEILRTQFNFPTAQVILNRVAPLTETLAFAADETTLAPAQAQRLERIIALLRQYPALGLEITVNQTPTETGVQAQARSQTLSTYLQTQGQIQPDRLSITTATATPPNAQVRVLISKTQTLPSAEISPEISPEPTSEAAPVAPSIPSPEAINRQPVPTTP